MKYKLAGREGDENHKQHLHCKANVGSEKMGWEDPTRDRKLQPPETEFQEKRQNKGYSLKNRLVA